MPKPRESTGKTFNPGLIVSRRLLIAVDKCAL
jgi:hypothetical protein